MVIERTADLAQQGSPREAFRMLEIAMMDGDPREDGQQFEQRRKVGWKPR